MLKANQAKYARIEHKSQGFEPATERSSRWTSRAPTASKLRVAANRSQQTDRQTIRFSHLQAGVTTPPPTQRHTPALNNLGKVEIGATEQNEEFRHRVKNKNLFSIWKVFSAAFVLIPAAEVRTPANKKLSITKKYWARLLYLMPPAKDEQALFQTKLG